MTAELPAPLVPVEVDLRGFEFMPLFGDRLFKSETWIAASAEAKIAMLRLWWHSYAHEVPAGSLPDNDVLLSEHAGYGVMVKGWKKVKAQSMRGYVLCSDGRWYHPMLSDLAKEGWKERVRNREKQAAWRSRNQKRDGNVTVTQPLHNAGEVKGEVKVKVDINPSAGDRPQPVENPTIPAGLAGEACRAMKSQGVASVNPSHPRLIAALEAGVTPQQLADLAAELRPAKPNPPMAYLLAVMENRLRNRASVPHQPPQGNRDAIEVI